MFLNIWRLTLSFPFAAEYDLSNFNVLYPKKIIIMDFCTANHLYLESRILFYKRNRQIAHGLLCFVKFFLLVYGIFLTIWICIAVRKCFKYNPSLSVYFILLYRQQTWFCSTRSTMYIGWNCQQFFGIKLNIKNGPIRYLGLELTIHIIKSQIHLVRQSL